MNRLADFFIASVVTALGATDLPDLGPVGEKLTLAGGAALMLWWILGRQTKSMEQLDKRLDDLNQTLKGLGCRAHDHGDR